MIAELHRNKTFIVASWKGGACAQVTGITVLVFSSGQNFATIATAILIMPPVFSRTSLKSSRILFRRGKDVVKWYTFRVYVPLQT